MGFSSSDVVPSPKFHNHSSEGWVVLVNCTRAATQTSVDDDVKEAGMGVPTLTPSTAVLVTEHPPRVVTVSETVYLPGVG